MDTINKKRQTDEIRRCARDPLYFFNTYVQVSHPIKGPLPFKTYGFQDDCVKAFIENKFVIVNKSRQLGLSTLSAAYAAWLLLFFRNKEIVVMATKLTVAQNFIKKVKFTIKKLPKWLVLPKVDKDNDRSFSFQTPSNSRIEAIPTAADAGRSEALSLLIVDEAAHVDDFEELWKGLYPTLSTGGRAIIISTPKGVGNWFHKLWVDAQSRSNEFFPIELPWDVHPERDEEWFKQQAANMSQKAIAQELLCDFLASGDTYLDPADIEWIGKCVRDPVRREGYDRNVWVWCDPIKDSQVKYIIAADVGRGDGTDFSAFHILCTMTGEIVAEFKGKIRPDHFAKLLIEYGRKYNNALICPERNTYGHHVIVELVNNKYTNIYFENPKDVYIGDYITPEMISDAGFDTQRDSRKRIVTKLEEIIRNKQIKCYSVRLWNELKTFVSQHDKPQALKNCSDDLVMALAIAVWLFDTSGVHSQYADELNKAMLAGFGVNVNSFDNMAGNGKDVVPSWIGMLPYAGTPAGPANMKRLRPHNDDPMNVDWLFKK